MHDDREIIEKRVKRWLDERIRPLAWGPGVPFDVTAHHVLGEPITFEDARARTYEPFPVGGEWGPPWSTTWFRLRGQVPEEWAGRRVEARIEFNPRGNPGFAAEALVYDDHGPLQGIAPYHRQITVALAAEGGEEIDWWMEAAANPDVSQSHRATPMGDRATAPEWPLYRLGRAELAVRHDDVYHLWMDLTLVDGLMRDLSDDDPRAHELRVAANRAIDALDAADVPATAGAARAALAGVLAVPARARAHRIHAGGHAHIDTAWLWPLRETRRKCARTFATVLRLMDEYPEHLFVCSQAVQWDWIREDHPDLFARMKEKVEEGRFVPVGSMWVEADCNVPSGESLARQFVHGKRWFLEHLGVETREVWIPDVFGYAANLPQLIDQAGCDWFLTQKISWNQQNRFPHHTFWWEGIDGTRVFTHFPPVDTYNATLRPAELRHAERNFADKGRATRSYLPFGLGDGGGGPNREMLEMARRQHDLDGVPRIVIEPPSRFFEQAHAEYDDAPVWRGELYLEMHRGTYTTQARTKWGNRRAELLLREAELWSAAVGLWPADELDASWKTTLLHQFHDILPGSSIKWVHDDTERDHAVVHETAQRLIDDALAHLSGPAPRYANPSPFPVHAVVEVPGEPGVDGQRLADGRRAVMVNCPAMGVGVAAAEPDDVHATERELRNGHLVVSIATDGTLAAIRDLDHDRDVLAGPGNVLQLHPDQPNQYDNWDVEHFDLARPRPWTTVDEIAVVETGPLLGAVRVTRSFGASRIEQTYVLRAGSRRLDVVSAVDWHEDEMLLKAAFGFDVRADTLACDIQYGHVHRPTHDNTSWDRAKFEICAHQWVDLAEHGYGVALLNDCKYGHDVSGRVVRLTLLRAPRYPDPVADRGAHSFTYSVFPHPADRAAVIAEGWALNAPVRLIPAGGDAEMGSPALAVDHPGVVVTAVKRADDGSDDLVVRLHEALGGRARCTLAVDGATSAAVTDLLERPDHAIAVGADGTIALELSPFEVRTLRIT